jgi:NAD(P)-dependent dehydrogenase (short-subunit alcohol dehydrogenase family)
MNKTILITGCSSGIGKVAAKLFAAKGWNVVATMRATKKETGLADSANLLLIHLDVQDRDSIRRVPA